MKLTTRILIGLSLGAAIGITFSAIDGGALEAWMVGGLFDTVGTIFVNALKLLIVPVVFFTLTCGAAAMGADIRMGKMAVHTLALYLLTTCVAITVALLVANVVDPGMGVELKSDYIKEAVEAPPPERDHYQYGAGQYRQGHVRAKYAAVNCLLYSAGRFNLPGGR